MTAIASPNLEPFVSALSAREVLDRAEALVPLLRAHADAIEAGRRLTPEVHEAFVAEGFYRLTVPLAHGGFDLSVPEVMRLLEVLAAGDASSAWSAWASMGVGVLAAFMTEDGAEEILGARDFAGASSVSRPGTAVAVEGGYRVSAHWPFLSNSPQARWIGGPAFIHDGDNPRLTPDGEPHLVFVFMPADRVRLLDNWDTTGLRGTGSNDGDVSNVFVPEAFVVDFARGPRPGLSTLHYVHLDTAANVTCASIAMGIARHAIDAFARLAPRKARMDGTMLADSALAKLAIAESETRLAQARGYLYETAERTWEAQASGGLPGEEWVPAASLASAAAVDAAVEVVSKLYRAAGSAAVFAANPLDRCLRDVYTLAAHLLVQRENYVVHGATYFA